jgi:Fur family ferric uptake transcriptional regulator
MDDKYGIDFDTFLEGFKKQISKKGYKNTIQKDYILKVLFFMDEHLTAEQINTKVKMEYNLDIGIATVYRTMKFFEEFNMVKLLDIGDGIKRYELSMALHHDHLICTSCAKIIEFTDDFIEEQQVSISKEHNFDLKDHVMTIYGLCEKCQ